MRAASCLHVRTMWPRGRGLSGRSAAGVRSARGAPRARTAAGGTAAPLFQTR